MENPVKLGEITFSAILVKEYSHGSFPIGEHKSTMTLYKDGSELDYHGISFYIEWECKSAGEYETIGLWFDNKNRLTDYDGVFSLPREAIKLIRTSGFTVPKDMI